MLAMLSYLLSNIPTISINVYIFKTILTLCYNSIVKNPLIG
ncbi:17058_t:CDS:2 [Cetraspora pellucida]|uniref:17058_t:CDS:1 n=1 Tax=Cetraspora pellucida TaxID=1433469 RepID=A0A9N9GTQ5_9GLOM|nr:17058_t:CDS:2 [Cetraspora pellucida]